MTPYFYLGISIATAPIIGLIGVWIGAKITSAASDRANLAAEKRHFRDMGMKLALTNFEYASNMAQDAADRHGDMFCVPPLKVFLIQSINMVEIISDTTLSKEDLASRISECEDLAQSIYRDAQEKEKRD